MTNVVVCGGATSLSRLDTAMQAETRRRDRINRIVEAWPDLTPDQCDRVSMLLRPALPVAAA